MARKDMARRDMQAQYVDDRYGNRSGGRDIASWARVIGMLLLSGVVSVVFVHLYWGPAGVKVFGYIMLAVLLVFGVWGMIMGNMAIFSAHTRSIVRSTTQALIDVQVSDDKGEVGRTVAAVQAAHHDSAMLARRMMTTARQIASDDKAAGGASVPSIQELMASQFGAGYMRDDEDDDDDELV